MFLERTERLRLLEVESDLMLIGFLDLVLLEVFFLILSTFFLPLDLDLDFVLTNLRLALLERLFDLRPSFVLAFV